MSLKYIYIYTRVRVCVCVCVKKLLSVCLLKYLRWYMTHITSVISSCHMCLFMTGANIVTHWS